MKLYWSSNYTISFLKKPKILIKKHLLRFHKKHKKKKLKEPNHAQKMGIALGPRPFAYLSVLSLFLYGGSC